MSDEGAFRSAEEELERLTAEVSQVKSLLKEISAKVNQIERHAKRAFGVKPKVGSARSKSTSDSTSATSEQPSITPADGLRLFDELAAVWQFEDPTAAEQRLNAMSTPDLKVIAHEVGVTFRSKPSRKALADGILGRINERVMLSRNVNVTPARSAQQATEES
jgi:hypothetical protein